MSSNDILGFLPSIAVPYPTPFLRGVSFIPSFIAHDHLPFMLTFLATPSPVRLQLYSDVVYLSAHTALMTRLFRLTAVFPGGGLARTPV